MPPNMQLDYNIDLVKLKYPFFPWALAFVMTCKPPLYMGPEHIKYLSDKTIDVSYILHLMKITPKIDVWGFHSEDVWLWLTCRCLSERTGGAPGRQSGLLDCWILRQLVLWMPIFCAHLCWSVSQVREPKDPQDTEACKASVGWIIL